MAKEDLDKIQAELKAAIQNHQILVGKMQFDPQNPSYKKQLHDLQIEITSLDDRQKVIVQILRKELVNKQQTSNQASSLNTNASQQQHQAQSQQQVHIQKQQQQTHPPQQVHAVQQQMHISQQQSNSVQRQQPHTVQRQSPSPQRQTTPHTVQQQQQQQQQSQLPQRQLQSHPVQLSQSPPQQQQQQPQQPPPPQQQQQQQQLPCQSSSPQQPQSPHQHLHIVQQQSQSPQQQLQPMQQQISQHSHSHSQPASSSPQQALTAAAVVAAPPPTTNNNNNNNQPTAAPLQSADFIKKNDNVKCPSILNTPHSRVSSPTVNNSISSRSNSPPIRVPQYTISKTLLQNKNQMAPPNVLPPKRTCTEGELDIKKTVDKKPPITCDEKNVKTSQNMSRKLQYMASLDLVTPETLKGKMEEKYNNEICRKRAMERLMIDGTLRDPWHKGMMGGGRELQSKRSERKRRSTANPQFSYSLESDRKRMNYLVGSNITTGTKRPRGRPPKHGTSPTNSRPGTPDSSDSNASIKNGIVNGSTDDIHDGLCFVCQKAGRLLICDGCGMAYHPTCLEPPVATFPNGPWRCYKCQNEKNSTGGSVTLDIVHNYIINKTAKDEERKKLQRRNTELNNERIQLETNTKQLSQSLYQCIQQKQELMKTNKKVQQSADNINNFLQIFQS